MRPAGIITPTLCEAEYLIQSISDREEFDIQNKTFFKGLLNDIPVVLCLCGAGKSNAAHGAALLFERFQPGLVYVIGVAGAYPGAGMDIGDIAVADKEIYGDEGLLLKNGFETIDTIGIPFASIGACRYYNEFPLQVPKRLRDHRHRGAFVTVSACTGTLGRGLEIKKRFNALCENMEGASIAHVCLLNNTPAAEFRGISNIIEDRTGKPLDKSAILEAAEKVQRFFLEKVITLTP